MIKPNNIKGRVIERIIAFKWKTCNCGCERSYRFEIMWRVRTFANIVSQNFQYYSCQEFPTQKDLIDYLDIQRHSQQGTLEMLRPILTVDDYCKLRYNIHLYTVPLTYPYATVTYFMLQVQEIPECTALAMEYHKAKDMLMTKLREIIQERYDTDRTTIPFPDLYDPQYSPTIHTTIKETIK